MKDFIIIVFMLVLTSCVPSVGDRLYDLKEQLDARMERLDSLGR